MVSESLSLSPATFSHPAVRGPLPGGGGEQGDWSSWGVRMPVFYFQQLSLTHGVTLLRSELCFPCLGKIRGDKVCIFPRDRSPGTSGAPPCSP